MKPRFLLFAILLAASASGAAEPAKTYAPTARAAHLKGALTALRDAPPAALQEGADYARALGRGACSAGSARLRVECLIVATQRYCRERADRDPRCPLYMDIVVSNVLADEQLIPTEKRYQIVRANLDYRPALARELHRVQGNLAVDFRLREGARLEGKGSDDDLDRLAAAIDHYCLEATDETKLSYPTCVSSLVWFIEETK